MSLYILHSMMFKIRCETSMKGGGVMMNLWSLDWEKLMHDS